MLQMIDKPIVFWEVKKNTKTAHNKGTLLWPSFATRKEQNIKITMENKISADNTFWTIPRPWKIKTPNTNS